MAKNMARNNYRPIVRRKWSNNFPELMGPV